MKAEDAMKEVAGRGLDGTGRAGGGMMELDGGRGVGGVGTGWRRGWAGRSSLKRWRRRTGRV